MLHWKSRVTWNISKNVTDTTNLFCRNCYLGTISVYVGYFSSTVSSIPINIWYMYIYCPLINTPSIRGVIIIQPKTPFLVIVFDRDHRDHDFDGPRDPRKPTLIP